MITVGYLNAAGLLLVATVLAWADFAAGRDLPRARAWLAVMGASVTLGVVFLAEPDYSRAAIAGGITAVTGVLWFWWGRRRT